MTTSVFWALVDKQRQCSEKAFFFFFSSASDWETPLGSDLTLETLDL